MQSQLLATSKTLREKGKIPLTSIFPFRTMFSIFSRTTATRKTFQISSEDILNMARSKFCCVVKG